MAGPFHCQKHHQWLIDYEDTRILLEPVRSYTNYVTPNQTQDIFVWFNAHTPLWSMCLAMEPGFRIYTVEPNPLSINFHYSATEQSTLNTIKHGNSRSDSRNNIHIWESTSLTELHSKCSSYTFHDYFQTLTCFRIPLILKIMSEPWKLALPYMFYRSTHVHLLTFVLLRAASSIHLLMLSLFSSLLNLSISCLSSFPFDASIFPPIASVRSATPTTAIFALTRLWVQC